MNWKQKYIVGITVMSMFFTLPLVSAEDGDGEVVVYGEGFEPEETPVETPEETPVEEPEETPIEEPEETPVEEPEETPVEVPEETPVEEPEETPIEKSEETPVEEPEETPVEEPEETPIEEPEETPVEEPEETPVEEPEETPVEEPEEMPVEEPEETPVEELEETPVEEPEETSFGEPEEIPETEIPLEEMTTGFGGESGNEGTGEEGNGYKTSPAKPTTGGGTTKKTTAKNAKEKNLKTQKSRFVKLLSDETYEYYLDRSAVRWVNMPYSTSEYMADVWIRMIEREDSDSEELYQYLSSGENEIADAAEKGIAYSEVDKKVLRSRKYFLEHYYIRPKTKQIQFLCELEVIGRPQNAVSERPYEYKNWENLIPGSVESYIYSGVLKEIGTGKANKRGHMTFVDMLDEYARIALN